MRNRLFLFPVTLKVTHKRGGLGFLDFGKGMAWGENAGSKSRGEPRSRASVSARIRQARGQEKDRIPPLVAWGKRRAPSVLPSRKFAKVVLFDW